MSKLNYNSQAELIAKVIDIAVKCFTEFPPEGFNEMNTKQFIDTYLDYKNKALNPEPSFKNITSLNYIKNDILTYFQESSGKTVECFWNEVFFENLGIKRVNRFEKIIKRGTIKNQNEYDIIIDLYNPYIETNMLSETEINKINELISNFENKNRK